ncbi:hypothetical protein [Proteus terrae]|uniref:hypothetical protein n=1 Tax=Proteus terrae TaxID=1574161 RepID=UPI001F354429|nr:hypothetical protein [Proteus terrae]
MTVSTELSHEEYVGNGVTTDFDFRFRIFEGKHLIVVVADSDGNETTLKNGTDYTIVGAGSYHGGKVVLNKPLAQGWKILLERDLPVVQETDLRNQGKFFAEVHEDAFDYLTMLIQKALGTFSLSLRKPTYLSNYYDAKGNCIANLAQPKFGTDSANKDYVDNSIKDIDSKTLRVKDKPINALPNTQQRANKILAFDDNGQPITVLPESGSAADVLIELGKPTGASLIGLPQGQSLADALSNRIYPGGDAAKKARDIIESGRTPIFMNGEHFFSSYVEVGSKKVFIPLSDNKGFLTQSKDVKMYPEINVDAFFSTEKKASTDITLSPCTVFGTSKENPDLRLVQYGFSNHSDLDARTPRLILNRTNFVGFKESLDTFTWSSSFYNTDAGWNDVGYHFRNTENTSLRLIGTGATSCGTCYHIERAVYGVMLNSFSDKCDVGIKIDNAQGLSIISPGFEYCKQLAKIGTDDWRVTTEGVQWIGGYVYKRNRENTEDTYENWGDYGVELFRVFRSSFDFSGINIDFIKRNKKCFIKLKSCFDIRLHGVSPEFVYVDPLGDSSYDDIKIGSEVSNTFSTFYISDSGDDVNTGESEEKSIKTSGKMNFIIRDTILRPVGVFINGPLSDGILLKNKKISYNNGTAITINGSGNFVKNIRLLNIDAVNSGLLIKNIVLNGNGIIDNCRTPSLDNVIVKQGYSLRVISSSVYINNITLEDGASITALNGSQVRIGKISGGSIISNSSIIYINQESPSTSKIKTDGGQIFQ